MFTRRGRLSAVRAALAVGLAVFVQSVAPAFATPVAPHASEANASTDAAVERFGALPVCFEPNVGQFDEQVEFVARGGGYTLFLSPGESVIALRGRDAEAEPAVMRTRLVGASAQSSGVGVGELPGVTNYFLGNDPSRWRTGIVSYAAVRYGEVYPGVDLVYYGNGQQLEYDFVVAPGADPSAMRMQVEGAERVRVDEAGDLVLEVAGGELRQRAPLIYQEGAAGRERIAGGYAVRGDVVTFAVGDYDPARPLIVDPVLAYSRALALSDESYGIAVGADGSAYVSGYAPSHSNNGLHPNFEAFVTKLDPTGSSLVYSTYFGGTSGEFASGIAIDANGSAYVTGSTTSTNFPTVAPLQASRSGLGDAFVTKLSPSGTSLVYSTYLGGSGAEPGEGIAVGADGSAYVSGYTTSTNFPRAAPLQAAYGGGTHDAFVTKIAPSGTSLVYSTYLGGSGGESGEGIAIGADGSAYVFGYTSSTNFPRAAPLQAAYGGGTLDAFVTKIAPSGTSLVYSTYLGGSSQDQSGGIAVGADGSAYVSGYTDSTNFPTAAPFQASRSGANDAFVTKIAPSGTALVYSTYLGGSGDGDYSSGIAVGGDGSAYVAGETHSPDFPTVAAVQSNLVGLSDAFVTKLSASGGSLVYSTFLDAINDYDYDFGPAIAVGADGSAYVAGTSALGDIFYTGYAMKLTPGTATTPGVYVPSSGAWFLRNANAAGAADLAFTYGAGGLAVPIAGDWNGDGVDTPGVYFRATGAFFLKNANSGGAANLAFTFGASGAGLVPLAGDWDGDGVDTVGLYAPATGAFFLRNANAPGPADLVFAFGAGGLNLVPLSGDWNGDGIDTVGLYNSASGAFFLKNANAGGGADLVFTFGAGGQGFVPLSGDWDGDGRDTVGLASPPTGAFFLRNASAPGAADLVFSYGPPGATPLAGDWNGL